ncbi:MAG: NEW3 domain-containing protein [Candidatus Limnocylindria bacterium]
MFAIRTASRVLPVLWVAALVVPPSTLAQVGLQLTTPYPSVEVAPGVSASFPLTLSAEETTRADVAVEGLPDGWTATLRGGGNQVHSVIVRPDEPPELTLDVRVPEDAAEGAQRITVTATGGGDSVELRLDLTVIGGGGGEVSLTSDFPSLRGDAASTFRFSLTLINDTPQQLTFSLQGTGPAGWDVSVQPSGQETAASVTVDAGGRQSLSAEATPPVDVSAGPYSIVVDAVGGGGTRTAEVELGIEVTGRVAMELTTPDQRLNATANAGSTQDFQVTVLNSGTAPLTNVALSGTGPSDWTVEFDTPTVETVGPNESVTATAQITPSSDAIAGDYVVTLSASTEGANESLDVRVTVETPPIAGIIGLLLIAAVIGGLAWIFRRYGRR